MPLILAVGILLAGCSGLPEAEPGKADEAKLEVIDEAAFTKLLRQNRGKVVLIDFWATWCPECKELFPHTVALHKQFADRGLAVISISFDDEEQRPAARRFLIEQGATFDNFVSKYGAGEKSVEVFAITGGALPHFKLYDRDGKLHKTFSPVTEAIEPERIDQAIEELLNP